MNRSFISVIAGGFGTDGSSTGDDQEVGEHREITAEETAELLKNSHSVIITPGTGSMDRRRRIMKANEKDTFRHSGYNAFANGVGDMGYWRWSCMEWRSRSTNIH
ncbi:NAD(P)(+) transhydrogenase (Re/Si-specific) subunit beta [Pseudomonas aeruginosa]|uniref:NAD(P)(+) transhydrogenase (Re/Si-specific) subunit beta n=1 Tax=Pseudomonas aeruginosa TaxID=287 RepID=UPI0031B6FF2B